MTICPAVNKRKNVQINGYDSNDNILARALNDLETKLWCFIQNPIFPNNVTILGNLTIQGDSDLQGDLHVGGITEFDGDVTFNGDSHFLGNVDQLDITKAQSFDIGDCSFGADKDLFRVRADMDYYLTDSSCDDIYRDHEYTYTDKQVRFNRFTSFSAINNMSESEWMGDINSDDTFMWNKQWHVVGLSQFDSDWEFKDGLYWRYSIGMSIGGGAYYNHQFQEHSDTIQEQLTQSTSGAGTDMQWQLTPTVWQKQQQVQAPEVQWQGQYSADSGSIQEQWQISAGYYQRQRQEMNVNGGRFQSQKQMTASITDSSYWQSNNGNYRDNSISVTDTGVQFTNMFSGAGMGGESISLQNSVRSGYVQSTWSWNDNAGAGLQLSYDSSAGSNEFQLVGTNSDLLFQTVASGLIKLDSAQDLLLYASSGDAYLRAVSGIGALRFQVNGTSTKMVIDNTTTKFYQILLPHVTGTIDIGENGTPLMFRDIYLSGQVNAATGVFTGSLGAASGHITGNMQIDGIIDQLTGGGSYHPAPVISTTLALIKAALANGEQAIGIVSPDAGTTVTSVYMVYKYTDGSSYAVQMS